MDQSKKIDVVSKSSLVALKAELLRKQDEVAKTTPLGGHASSSHVIRPFPKLKPNAPVSNKGVQERAQRDAEFYAEEEKELSKSRKALEAKSKLYDRLASGQDISADQEEVYLVNFAEKVHLESKTTKVVSEEEKEEIDDFSDSNIDPEDDWVDYTDCLGRTRRCLRKDLPSVRDRDVDLARSLGHENDSNQPSTSSAKEEDVQGDPDDPRRRELLSSDMRREQLREKWEAEEETLRQKDNIHYQDVLFDEARNHGVGYYAFSRDEERRQAQQQALQRLQEETKQQQQAALETKARRKAQLHQRLQAARRRKRERLGLPPEEDEPPPVEEPPPAPPEPEPELLQRDPKRDNLPVRDWDKGKEGVEKSGEMSQDQWVRQKRSERSNEFAPPSSYAREHHKHRDSRAFDQLRFQSKQSKIKEYQNENRKEKERIQNKKRASEEEFDDDDDDDEVEIGPPIPPPTQPSTRPPAQYVAFKFNTSKSKKYKTIDELADSDSEKTTIGPIFPKQGAEIPPPPTMEYFGPSGSSGPKPVQPPNDLESSIEAGLRYLREQFEAKEKQKDKGLLDIM